jgi:hypothetical protein
VLTRRFTDKYAPHFQTDIAVISTRLVFAHGTRDLTILNFDDTWSHDNFTDSKYTFFLLKQWKLMRNYIAVNIGLASSTQPDDRVEGRVLASSVHRRQLVTQAAAVFARAHRWAVCTYSAHNAGCRREYATASGVKETCRWYCDVILACTHHLQSSPFRPSFILNETCRKPDT